MGAEKEINGRSEGDGEAGSVGGRDVGCAVALECNSALERVGNIRSHVRFPVLEPARIVGRYVEGMLI